MRFDSQFRSQNLGKLFRQVQPSSEIAQALGKPFTPKQRILTASFRTLHIRRPEPEIRHSVRVTCQVSFGVRFAKQRTWVQRRMQLSLGRIWTFRASSRSRSSIRTETGLVLLRRPWKAAMCSSMPCQCNLPARQPGCETSGILRPCSYTCTEDLSSPEPCMTGRP